MSRYSRALALGLLLFLCGVPMRGGAQSRGFQLNHYQPTPAGEWSFWVDHPWYSSTRYFAGGFTLNYARAPFILGEQNSDGSFTRVDPIIAHQLTGHFDIAGSFLDRVNLSFSLPVIFYEAGTARFGVTPLQGAAADIIRRAMVRMPGALKEAGLKARMLLQVHDELVFEAPEKEAEATCKLVTHVMEGAPLPAVQMSVPLVVEALLLRNAPGRRLDLGKKLCLEVGVAFPADSSNANRFAAG